MIRLTFYILLAISFALAAAWITSNPGQVLITWQGWEIRFSIAVFIALLIFYSILLWLFGKVFKWLNVKSYFQNPERLAAKRKKAETDLDLAWSAYALEEYDDALKHGRRAKSAIGDDHNVLRLLASATKRAGKEENPYLEKLKSFSESSTWVKKQELDLLLKEKSWKDALSHVQEMLEAHPQSSTLQKLSYSLPAKLGNWQQASEAFQTASKIDQNEKGSTKAAIEYCLALEEKATGKKTESLALAKSSLKSDATFVPSAILASRNYIEQNDQKAAEKILNNIWKKAPNAELAEMLLDLYPQESATEAFRRINKITDSNSKSISQNHLLALCATKANHWPEARHALENLINADKANSDTYKLLADLEKKQKNDEQSSEKYILQAEKAVPATQWVCKSCQTNHVHYVPVCSHCEEFNSLEYND